jgi:hypothetical protein
VVWLATTRSERIRRLTRMPGAAVPATVKSWGQQERLLERSDTTEDRR